MTIELSDFIKPFEERDMQQSAISWQGSKGILCQAVFISFQLQVQIASDGVEAERRRFGLPSAQPEKLHMKQRPEFLSIALLQGHTRNIGQGVA